MIFIDEIDGLVGSRDNPQMHEATRRLLSVILQRVEGFASDMVVAKKTQNGELQGGGKGHRNVLICATNRKSDLDAALLSRFDLTVRYTLPDAGTRAEVFKKYAKQLGRTTIIELAEMSEDFSNRDIKDVCEMAERAWAAKAIAQGDPQALAKGLPTSVDYKEALENRKQSKKI